eukprot:12953995-Alexandrium_andersonii.AAC.1
MFAGAWGRGAADAAYGTALSLEACGALRVRFAGGVVDLFKAFDGMAPQIVACCLERAGFPAPLL